VFEDACDRFTPRFAFTGCGGACCHDSGGSYGKRSQQYAECTISGRVRPATSGSVDAVATKVNFEPGPDHSASVWWARTKQGRSPGGYH
jgi:hypothetical protein